MDVMFFDAALSVLPHSARISFYKRSIVFDRKNGNWFFK